MNTYARKIEGEAIQFRRKLNADINEVWKYLTESEKRGEWLASGEMDLKPDGDVTLKFQHSNLSKENDPYPDRFKKYENGETYHGKILQCEPPALLSYTWGGDSEVTFELEEDGGDTILTLTHRKLGEDPDMILGVAGGWHTHLHILGDKLNDREPEAFWKNYLKNEEEYRKRLY